MKYYKDIISKDNLILSCDMVRIVFRFYENIFHKFNDFCNLLSVKDNKYNFKVFNSFGMFHYRTILNFKYSESSFVVGLNFNGVKSSDKENCFIEFNPNKCMVNNYVVPILDFIKEYGRALEIVRFDFAIDIKCKRSFVNLSKDRRKYNKCYNVEKTSIDIENVTEYLGCRNKNGFVKLYNKTIESNLDYSLTRLEITLDKFDYDNFIKELPKVYFVKNASIFDTIFLNDTDKVLLSLLMQNENSLMYIKMLGRGKQDKYKKILFDLNSIINVTENDYYSVIRNIRQLIA